MKNKFVKLIAIASLALVGCSTHSNTSSATSSTGDASSTAASTVTPATSDTTSTTPTFTITAAASSVKDSYEVGESFTIRFNVTSTDANAAKTLSFTLENANENKPSVTSSSDHSSVVITTTGINVSLYAKAIGTATLVATSTVNPNCSCRVNLTVVKPLSSLSTAWKNINNLKNYTLNVTRTATSDEISQHGWEADAAVPSKRIKVTENSLIAEKATVGDDLSSPTWGATYETNGTSVLGLATDKDGYGFILGKDSNGYKSASTSRITGADGYVSGTNLSGYGDNASSPNDIFLTAVSSTEAIAFGGMRVVNSTWLSSFTKDYSNEYIIEADSTATSAVQYNVAFTKVALWQIIDFDSYWSTATSSTSSQYVDLAQGVDVTITVVASNNVVITLDTGVITYTATLSDIGTTASETGLDTYLGTATTTAPELTGDMKLVVDSFKTYDFYIASQTSYGTYYQYFYKNYYFEYYPSDFISAYAAAGYGTLTSYGYVLAGNYAYQFTFTDEVKGTDGTVTTPAKVTVSDTPLKNTSGNVIDYSTLSDKDLAFATTIGSFSATSTFGYAEESGLIYSFSAYSTSSGGTVYVSSSKSVSDELSQTFFGSKTIEQVIAGWGSGYSFDSYSTQISLTKSTTTDESGNNTTTLSGISLGFGSFSMQGQSGYMYPVTITFGHAANSYHQTIIDAIDAKVTPAA